MTAALRGRSGPDPGGVVRFSHVLPPGLGFRYSDRNVLAVSPDGRRFVCNTPQGLYLRSMDDGEGRMLGGSSEPLAGPFFSPDGQSVGFLQGGQLKRQKIDGGAPVAIVPAGSLFGASWAADNLRSSASLKGSCG